MAYKINDLTALGRNLDPTDELEVSLAGATGSRKITGAQIIAAAGLPAWVETNATDLTLWNNGKGNIATNTSFGDGALKSNTSGANNTIVGRNASDASTTAQSNVAIGSEALGATTTGSSNVAIGYDAQSSLTTGSSNVAIGATAHKFATTAANNVIIGNGAGSDNVSGQLNVCIGGNVVTGSTMFGTAVGFNTFVGEGSVALGAFSTADSGGIAIGCNIVVGAGEIGIGSSSYPAGTVASQVNTSTKYWQVTINGTVQKILLA
jgi:hypothetical protein